MPLHKVPALIITHALPACLFLRKRGEEREGRMDGVNDMQKKKRDSSLQSIDDLRSSVLPISASPRGPLLLMGAIFTAPLAPSLS